MKFKSKDETARLRRCESCMMDMQPGHCGREYAPVSGSITPDTYPVGSRPTSLCGVRTHLETRCQWLRSRQRRSESAKPTAGDGLISAPNTRTRRCALLWSRLSKPQQNRAETERTVKKECQEAPREDSVDPLSRRSTAARAINLVHKISLGSGDGSERHWRPLIGSTSPMRIV